MLRYAGPFLFLGAIPALYYGVGPSAPLLSVVALLAALTVAELVAPRGDGPDAGPGPGGFRTLVLAYIPLQILTTAWAIWLSPYLSAWGLVALAISLGVTTGVFGVLAAHEAAHSGERCAALLGAALLTMMSYRHFRVAHLHGHHRFAATALDPATARLGEGFYRFLLRSVFGQVREAWMFERRRGWRRNRVLGDLGVMALLLAAIAAGRGPRALGFFLAQSAVAVTVLELFNYIAHYGLLRRRTADGRLERLADRHSWNSSNVLANALIFNMGRHSAHHLRPAAPYQSLTARPGPELPLGYAGSIVLALVPPLWRRIMDDAARSWNA